MSEINWEEKRDAKRVGVRFAVTFEGRGARGKGAGFVRNVSMTGALVEDADTLLMAGAIVTLRFSFFEDSTPVDVKAEVMRETPDGFGVRFIGLDARIKSVLRMAIGKLTREVTPAFDDEDDDTTLLRVKK